MLQKAATWIIFFVSLASIAAFCMLLPQKVNTCLCTGVVSCVKCINTNTTWPHKTIKNSDLASRPCNLSKKSRVSDKSVKFDLEPLSCSVNEVVFPVHRHSACLRWTDSPDQDTKQAAELFVQRNRRASHVGVIRRPSFHSSNWLLGMENPICCMARVKNWRWGMTCCP